MTDVLLVSMPFGPLLSPSLGLSLLQPQVRARGITCRIEYFTLPFAERIGEPLYSRITTENRVMARAFVGEWIFSHALFDWSRGHDERYLSEVLLKPPAWLGRSPTPPPGRAAIREMRAAAAIASAFVDQCADRIVMLTPRLVGFTSVFQQHLASLALAKRIKTRLPETVVVMGGANCEAAMGVETVRQFPFVDAIVSGEGDEVFAEVALIVRVESTALVVAPNRRFQSPSLSTTTRSPADSSAAVKKRPARGATPSTEKYRSDTNSPQMRSAVPVNPMLNAAGSSSTASENTSPRARMSSKSGYEIVKYWKPLVYVLYRRTRRSESRSGSGRTKNPLTMENETLVAAMPNASVSTITRLVAGAFSCWRTPNARSPRR